MKHRACPVIAAVAIAAAACTSSAEVGQVPPPPSAGPSAPVSTPSKASTPGFTIEQVTGGLQHGWDIGFLPDGKVLISQRPGRFALLSNAFPGATMTQVKADTGDILVKGEGGLMGLIVHSDFASSRKFTTCQTHTENGRPTDVRLVTWRLNEDEQVATRLTELITGLPVNPSGRHSGCRPTYARDGSVLVGTGDTARDGRISQDRTNLGGKVLRIDLETGGPVAGNPFIDSANANERLVYTYGNRNVQGVAPRPNSDQVFIAEHGPDKNDEINLVKAGANYGWDPSRGGATTSYDESVPMTDLERFPDAIPAKWQSGEMTEAICAAVFLSGPQWGTLDGALVVTALKGHKLLVLTLNEAGDVVSVAIPPEFDDTYGRLRAARIGPDGALYITTTNGGEDDKLLRVTPS